MTFGGLKGIAHFCDHCFWGCKEVEDAREPGTKGNGKIQRDCSDANNKRGQSTELVEGARVWVSSLVKTCKEVFVHPWNKCLLSESFLYCRGHYHRTEGCIQPRAPWSDSLPTQKPKNKCQVQVVVLSMCLNVKVYYCIYFVYKKSMYTLFSYCKFCFHIYIYMIFIVPLQFSAQTVTQ